MKKPFYLILFFVSLFSVPALAQDPCSDPENIGLLRQGRSYTAPCDSLYILSKQQYFKFNAEILYYKDLLKDYKSLSQSLDETNVLRDSLNLEQKNFIAKQDSAIQAYNSFLTRSNQLVERSTQNTDKALDEISKLRIQMWLYSIGALVLGGLIGAVAF